MNVAAAAIVDFLDCDEQIVHLQHPHPVPWSDIFIPISSALGFSLVPYAEWLGQLENCGKGVIETDEVELMKSVPALKLLDFYRGGLLAQTEVTLNGAKQSSKFGEGFGMPALSMQNALKASPTLADPKLGILGAEDARRWLTYWHMI